MIGLLRYVVVVKNPETGKFEIDQDEQGRIKSYNKGEAEERLKALVRERGYSSSAHATYFSVFRIVSFEARPDRIRLGE